MKVPRVTRQEQDSKVNTNNKPKLTWKERLPYAIFAIAFVSVTNLFIVGGLPNIIAAVLGWHSGKFVFKILNEKSIYKNYIIAAKITITTIFLIVAIGAVSISKMP